MSIKAKLLGESNHPTELKQSRKLATIPVKMTDTVNKIIPVGCIECSRGNTSQPLYITITDSVRPPYQTVKLLHKQGTNQNWCLVRTPSLQDRFIICSHPIMDRVLVATTDPVEGYDKAKHIKVEVLPSPIVQGQPLPKPLKEFYQFHMELDRSSGGYYLCSESRIYPDTVMQGGYQTSESSKDAPNSNDYVTLHNRQRTIRELFWFEIDPNKQ